MKIHLNTTEDWKQIKDAIKITEEYLKDFGVKFTYKKIDLDVKNEALYETENSWNWLKLVSTKSLSKAIVYTLGSLHNKDADVYVLAVDRKKALSDKDLEGQHILYQDKGCIELYAKKSTRKQWGLPYNAYVLVHEIFHYIADSNDLKDTLHTYLKNNKNLDAYKAYLLQETKPQVEKLQPLVERQANALIILAKIIGLDLRITSGFRSIKEQNELYAQGRTKPGNIVTNAKGGESLHNYGVAFDIVDRKKGYNLSETQWKALGVFWKRLGGEWGGDWTTFVDKPHFEMKLGYTLKDFQLDKVDYSKYR